MANLEQLEILKQGVQIWNIWREKNPQVEINLYRADLSGVDLSNVNLSYANLGEANLEISNLNSSNLIFANLRNANLRDSSLIGADLRQTQLSEINLRHADLNGADLGFANLVYADLFRTNLFKANLSNASLGHTSFVEIELSNTYGLDGVFHHYPSNISTSVLQLSKGEIPEVFLRGCGLSDWEIESAKLYKPALSNQEINNSIYKIFDFRANQSIQISPLFISYSHADTSFVEKFETHLTEKGIRFWRDIHNATAGRLETQIDRAMHQNPTVLLILSENSTASDWVEHETRLARDLEKEIGKDVLCPIALDDSWKSAKWSKRLMEQIKEYNILDYSNWQDNQAFKQVFNKMLSGLNMFYKPESSK